MSRFNGDKARFNRERKQNIHRRHAHPRTAAGGRTQREQTRGRQEATRHSGKTRILKFELHFSLQHEELS